MLIDSGKDKRFFSSPKPPNWLCGDQSTAHSLPVGNSPTEEQPEPETDDSPTSTAEVKEKRN